MVMHHCFQNICLLCSHFLSICSCCLWSSHNFWFGSGEGVRLLLIRIFECCRLGLHFKHTRAFDFTFFWNWCFLQARCLYFRLFRLNWLFGRPVSPLHVLLELGLRDELATALLERALLLGCHLLIQIFLVLFLALARRAKLLTAELEEGLRLLGFWLLAAHVGRLARRINQLFCALLLFHIF